MHTEQTCALRAYTYTQSTHILTELTRTYGAIHTHRAHVHIQGTHIHTCMTHIHAHVPDGPTMPSGLSAAPASRSTSPCEVIGSSSPVGPSVLTPAGPCRPAPALQDVPLSNISAAAENRSKLMLLFYHYNKGLLDLVSASLLCWKTMLQMHAHCL